MVHLALLCLFLLFLFVLSSFPSFLFLQWDSRDNFLDSISNWSTALVKIVYLYSRWRRPADHKFLGVSWFVSSISPCVMLVVLSLWFTPEVVWNTLLSVYRKEVFLITVRDIRQRVKPSKLEICRSNELRYLCVQICSRDCLISLTESGK